MPELAVEHEVPYRERAERVLRVAGLYDGSEGVIANSWIHLSRLNNGWLVRSGTKAIYVVCQMKWKEPLQNDTRQTKQGALLVISWI